MRKIALNQKVLIYCFMLINGTIDGEDIIDSKLYVPKSIAMKYMEPKLLGIQR